MSGVAAAVERYGADLVDRARAGDLDPVIGRDAEIARLVHVLLLRRTKNNPVLIGEPGVAKTAIVEELAVDLVDEAGDGPRSTACARCGAWCGARSPNPSPSLHSGAISAAAPSPPSTSPATASP